MSHELSCDFAVVGSGPGGATVAKVLAQQGHKVVILEWGDFQPLKGQFLQMAGIAAIPGKGAFINSNLSLLMRGITAGGTSAINFATAMPPPLEYFKTFDVDLTEETEEVKRLLPINKLPDHLIGTMAKKIGQSANALGYAWGKLDKFIYTSQCQAHCHRCTYGCPQGAKWNARFFLEDAIFHGAKLITRAKVHSVSHQNNKVMGVKYSHEGQIKSLRTSQVVVAAGGIGSPRILNASGIRGAGIDYFVDPVVAVIGSINNLQAGGREVPMAMGMHMLEQGIMLSDLTLPKPLFQAFAAQVGRFDRLASHAKTLTIMVKVRDELGGKIGAKWLNKSLALVDKEKLNTGVKIAKNILHEANASAIFKTHHFAAHPGATVKLGELVDSNLETEIEGLSVCDASVIPRPWGLPPSYTIICLALRLGKRLSH